MPNNGLLVSSICRITGTAYSPVAAGSPGPFDRKKPSGSCAIISSKRRARRHHRHPRPGLDQVAEDVALGAIIDGDDVRARLPIVAADAHSPRPTPTCRRSSARPAAG